MMWKISMNMYEPNEVVLASVNQLHRVLHTLLVVMIVLFRSHIVQGMDYTSIAGPDVRDSRLMEGPGEEEMTKPLSHVLQMHSYYYILLIYTVHKGNDGQSMGMYWHVLGIE